MVEPIKKKYGGKFKSTRSLDQMLHFVDFYVTLLNKAVSQIFVELPRQNWVKIDFQLILKRVFSSLWRIIDNI